MINILDFLSF